MNHSIGGRKVAWWARCLAILLLLGGLLLAFVEFNGGIAGYSVMVHLPDEGPLAIAIEIYLFVLIAYVAIVGRNPDGLFFVGSLSWPICSMANRPILRMLGIRSHRRSGRQLRAHIAEH
ncbi:hypothetical protein [Derxia lacustris]|uniref:hypothetical protein n=1 Tax=Derxia lacustris TaxID=764842 RepID=UPI00111C63F3|nr:hypothetical protein [Derxia lacustris]